MAPRVSPSQDPELQIFILTTSPQQVHTNATNQNAWALMIPPVPNEALANLVQTIIGDTGNIES